MNYTHYNPNPLGLETGDCVVRAISAALGVSWDDAYNAVVLHAKKLCMMPSTDDAWGDYLRSIGFVRHDLPDRCPDCYTVADFAADHPTGTYIIGTGTHAVTVANGSIMDAWDSSRKIPQFYYEKPQEEKQ